MSDELRAAAERLIVQEYGENGILHGPKNGMWSSAMDGHFVGRAYLAEHPAENVRACPYCGETYELISSDRLAINLAEHVSRIHDV